MAALNPHHPHIISSPSHHHIACTAPAAAGAASAPAGDGASRLASFPVRSSAQPRGFGSAPLCAGLGESQCQFAGFYMDTEFYADNPNRSFYSVIFSGFLILRNLLKNASFFSLTRFSHWCCDSLLTHKATLLLSLPLIFPHCFSACCYPVY